MRTCLRHARLVSYLHERSAEVLAHFLRVAFAIYAPPATEFRGNVPQNLKAGRISQSFKGVVGACGTRKQDTGDHDGLPHGATLAPVIHAMGMIPRFQPLGVRGGRPQTMSKCFPVCPGGDALALPRTAST